MITDSRQSARTLLDGAIDFHGHLGPFLILGMRMGVIARSILKPQSQDSLNAVVFVRSTPPASCTIDGIQVASKCTLGRGTIRVVEASDCIVGRFHLEGRTCTITVRPKVLNQLFEGVNTAAGGALVKMASDVMTASDEDLFEIESSK